MVNGAKAAIDKFSKLFCWKTKSSKNKGSTSPLSKNKGSTSPLSTKSGGPNYLSDPDEKNERQNCRNPFGWHSYFTKNGNCYRHRGCIGKRSEPVARIWRSPRADWELGKEWVKRKGPTGKVEPSEKFLEGEKFSFQGEISQVVVENDIPVDLVLNLDQTSLSYISPGKYTFFSNGSNNAPIKDQEDKRQITATFVVSAAGSFLPIQLIYTGKSERSLPKFTFPSCFHVTFTPNHWSNLEKSEQLFKPIIFPYQ